MRRGKFCYTYRVYLKIHNMHTFNGSIDPEENVQVILDHIQFVNC